MNFVTQDLHTTWPHGLASMALEVLVRGLLQEGQILWGFLVPEVEEGLVEEEVVDWVSSLNWTVMRVCRE